MKLTAKITEDFVGAVLTGEVVNQDFAKRIDAAWVPLLVARLPISVASIYEKEHTRGWVHPGRLIELRAYITNQFKQGDSPSPETDAAAFAVISQIEAERDEHYKNISNIRTAIEQVCKSVTTVMGVAKLLPQYAKYLPAHEKRGTRSEAKIAAEKAKTAVTVANVASWRANGEKKPSRRRSPKKPVEQNVVQPVQPAEHVVVKTTLNPKAVWPFPTEGS